MRRMPNQVDSISGTFTERLRALMAAQNIGMIRLAALSHVDTRQISRYRSGRVEPRDFYGAPTPNAYKLARALGVEVSELVPPLEREAA